MMKRSLLACALALGVALPAAAQTMAQPGPTLAATRAKGVVDCGAHPGAPGFGVTDSRGNYQGLEADTCRVVVGPRAEVPEERLVAAEATWLGPPPTEPFACLVQCRAQRTAAPAVVTPQGPARFTARFTGGPDASPGPISPGQPAVCYAGDRLLGGGWIEPPEPPAPGETAVFWPAANRELGLGHPPPPPPPGTRP